MKTNHLLIEQAKEDLASEAWNEMVQGYRQLIEKWISRYDKDLNSVQDISQDVLLAVVTELPKFKHNGRTGAFRNWLRVITLNRSRQFWKTRKRQPTIGGEEFEKMLEDLGDPNSELVQQWNREHDRFVVEQLLNRLGSFDQIAVDVFRQNVLDGRDAQTVAHEFEIPVGQVYKFKHRIMQRLQRECKTAAQPIRDSVLATPGLDIEFPLAPIVSKLDCHKAG